ncbi:hypothetical protein [Streptomyces sp. NPDC007088]|uniref:hypothetical protein n=1 Tax=Streptomyces sp. NPDC007088 TaxID=3364773 RepID=UPI0036AA51C5
MLADFFHRTVVHPWHFAYPGDQDDGSSDHGRTLACLLLAQLEALGTQLPITAASSALPAAHLQRPASPPRRRVPWRSRTRSRFRALDARDVPAAAERFPWAVAAPGEWHWPDGSDFLDVALSTLHPEEREGYAERLEAFVEQHRARLEEMLRTHGPGSTPASHGRHTLIGEPGTLVIVERMESVPFLLHGQWE